MSRWALLNGAYNRDFYYVGIVREETQVVGHLSMQVQSIALPGMQSLSETCVNTFAVEPTYRRRGYRRASTRGAMYNAQPSVLPDAFVVFRRSS